ncbi:MAG: hypothetical protein M1827_003607 [Pycnora praestabilis]|nr:MAG: hypothetical protein M1827_003607 [Pycnora praestabilis]
MPIIDEYVEISIKLTALNRILKEHDLPARSQDRNSLNCEKYIVRGPTEDHDIFSIEIALKPGFKYHHAHGIRVYFKFDDSSIYSHKYFPKPRDLYMIRTTDVTYSLTRYTTNVGTQWLNRPFMFASIRQMSIQHLGILPRTFESVPIEQRTYEELTEEEREQAFGILQLRTSVLENVSPWYTLEIPILGDGPQFPTMIEELRLIEESPYELLTESERKDAFVILQRLHQRKLHQERVRREFRQIEEETLQAGDSQLYRKVLERGNDIVVAGDIRVKQEIPDQKDETTEAQQVQVKQEISEQGDHVVKTEYIPVKREFTDDDFF